jgi:hypothetical protein
LEHLKPKNEEEPTPHTNFQKLKKKKLLLLMAAPPRK